MKKIFLFILGFIFIQTSAFCEEIKLQNKDIGLKGPINVTNQDTNIIDVNNVKDKYTIIKTKSNYTPIREGASTNAKRFSHVKKGAKIFADEDKNNFYRIDLGLDKYYWIEKKYVDVDSTANKKELQKIEKISFLETPDMYRIKIKTPVLTAYNEIETTKNSLDFILYDVVIDKEKTETKGKTSGDFKISTDKFGNLKISYFSKYPLTGHEVETCEDGLILKVKKPFKIDTKKPIYNLTIVIDPGHGGYDPGACANGLKEKDLNFQISKNLYAKLKKEGARVFLTRQEDKNIDLYDRIDIAKEHQADFLISIHQNSIGDKNRINEKHGVGVYYYNKEAYDLAKAVQSALVEGTKFKDDGVNFSSLALTRSANPICILIECGYIVHDEEAKKLSDDGFQKDFCDCIIKGLENYLIENFK